MFSCRKVTRDNVHQYIYLVAHRRLNTDIVQQSNAFMSGFRELVSSEWLQMFDQRELQRLISGDDGGDFDVKVLPAHPKFTSPYPSLLPLLPLFAGICVVLAANS